MQEKTENKTSPADAQNGHAAGVNQSAVIHKLAPPRSGSDAVAKLRQTGVGRLYTNHLKHNPAVRSAVMWVWRNFYPIYLRYFVITRSRKWKRLARFSDFIKDGAVNSYTLADTCTVESPIPRVFPIADQEHLAPPVARQVFPKVQVAIVNDALQYGGTNLVFTGDLAICHDLYDFKRDFTSEELHGRAIIDPKRGRMRCFSHDESPEQVAEAATFVDACAGNYAHWMTEVLPRIALFCTDDRFRSVPIVVNEGLHKNIMKSLLRVAGEGREIITLPVGRALAIHKLYLTSVTGYVPFDRRSSRLTGHSHGLFSPEALKMLSQRLSGQIPEIEGRTWPEKIYLRRNSGTRKIANASKLEQLLVRCGYTIIEPEKLTFSEQLHYFRNAKAIIGATGAAFANGIFCQRDAQVTVLMSKHESMIYRYWCNMLAPLGVKVDYILGNIVENQHLGIHGDFEVALEDVIEMLEADGSYKISAEVFTWLNALAIAEKRAAEVVEERNMKNAELIHPSALVSPEARLGEGVEIGPFCIIHGNVILGDRVKVAAYCELGIATPLGDGSPLIIGDGAVIRSHSVFYESSSFGARLVTGHRVTVRENTVAGIGFQIGTLSEIQGDCTVGDYVRFQSNVFVGKKTTIGNFVWVLPYVVLTNDPTPPSDNLIGCTLEDFASIAAASVVLPGVTVGHHALVAAKACVTKDVPPHKVVAGVPARVVGDTKDIKLRDGSGEPAYPWTRHFTRGYPEAVVAGWVKEEEKND
jgi:acetyltransferase-like isoleucine patch superfamily enzyme/capsular polysaccharide biosynthesis protein